MHIYCTMIIYLIVLNTWLNCSDLLHIYFTLILD